MDYISIFIYNRCRFQEKDKEEMKEILEMKRIHDRLVKKRLDRLSKEKDLSHVEAIITRK